MKRCHFKSEHSTAGVLCTANEALEAIIDDSAEVRSAARAATSHRGPVGKGTGMSGAAPAETGEAGTLNAVPCCPASPTSVPVPPVRALQSRAGGSSAAACPQGHCAALGVWAQCSELTPPPHTPHLAAPLLPPNGINAATGKVSPDQGSFSALFTPTSLNPKYYAAK